MVSIGDVVSIGGGAEGGVFVGEALDRGFLLVQADFDLGLKGKRCQKRNKKAKKTNEKTETKGSGRINRKQPASRHDASPTTTHLEGVVLLLELGKLVGERCVGRSARGKLLAESVNLALRQGVRPGWLSISIVPPGP